LPSATARAYLSDLLRDRHLTVSSLPRQPPLPSGHGVSRSFGDPTPVPLQRLWRPSATGRGSPNSRRRQQSRVSRRPTRQRPDIQHGFAFGLSTARRCSQAALSERERVSSKECPSIQPPRYRAARSGGQRSVRDKPYPYPWRASNGWQATVGMLGRHHVQYQKQQRNDRGRRHRI